MFTDFRDEMLQVRFQLIQLEEACQGTFGELYARSAIKLLERLEVEHRRLRTILDLHDCSNADGGKETVSLSIYLYERLQRESQLLEQSLREARLLRKYLLDKDLVPRDRGIVVQAFTRYLRRLIRVMEGKGRGMFHSWSVRKDCEKYAAENWVESNKNI